MNDQEKSREQLIAELVELRQRVAGERATPELKAAAALFQVAPLGIHECDTEGRITFVNPSQEAITGYTADELVGTDAWDRIVPGPEKDSLPAYFKYLVSERDRSDLLSQAVGYHCGGDRGRSIGPSTDSTVKEMTSNQAVHAVGAAAPQHDG